MRSGMFWLGSAQSGLSWHGKVDLDSVWQVWSGGSGSELARWGPSGHGEARQVRSGEALHGFVGCLAARLGMARSLWARLGRAGVVGLVVASRVEA